MPDYRKTTVHEGYPVVTETDRELTVEILYDVRVASQDAAFSLLPAVGTAYGEKFGLPSAPKLVSKQARQVINNPEAPLCRVLVIYRYDKEQRNRADEDSWVLDLTPETVHITSVKRPEDQRRWDRNSPHGCQDYDQLIGRSDSGDDVAGVDIYSPYGVLTVSKHFHQVMVTPDWLDTLEQAVAHVNDAEFVCGRLRAAPGDLLFLGPTIDDTSSERVKVQFRFLLRRTVRNLKIKLDVVHDNQQAENFGEKVEVTIDEKKGWEYLWYMHGRHIIPSLDPANNRLAQGVISVHVAKVYEPFDFGLLRAQLGNEVPGRIIGGAAGP